MVANIFVGIVALLHFYFLYLEMVVWTKPMGLRIFGQTLEQAKSSATLAANQGLYNGFLGAGLIWSLLEKEPFHAQGLKIFFLGCVIVAGLYGGYSVNKKILAVQAAPAFIALGLVFVGL